MAPSLRLIAAEVVRRAALRPDERVLDLGTGTGSGAAMARGDGRTVVGVDGAEGMLAIARREVPGVDFIHADYGDLPLPDAAFDAVLAVHSLHFAADPVVVLAEWRRVAAPGARLVLSVPGPKAATYLPLFERVYARYGVERRAQLPTRAAVAGWARAAGWRSVRTDADPHSVVGLADDEAFGRWMRTGSRSAATRAWSEEQFAAFCFDLAAITPRDADGAFAVPFGTIYLEARRQG
jgi:ubiquinone/menaquinone biosynthesis C-methylase UbiE